MLCDRLVYPFKEILRLPTLSVEFCDGQIGMRGVIGYKPIDIACGIIIIRYNTECVWIPLGCFQSSVFDNRIADNASLPINKVILYHLILYVVLGYRYEGYLLTVEVIEQLHEIDIFIHEVMIVRYCGD